MQLNDKEQEYLSQLKMMLEYYTEVCNANDICATCRWSKTICVCRSLDHAITSLEEEANVQD
jgi:hypothetical protein